MYYDISGKNSDSSKVSFKFYGDDAEHELDYSSCQDTGGQTFSWGLITRLLKLIIDFTVVQIQDKFQIEFRHSSFYGVPELKNELSIDLQKRVLTKSAHFNCGTL